MWWVGFMEIKKPRHKDGVWGKKVNLMRCFQVLLLVQVQALRQRVQERVLVREQVSWQQAF
jgi:hypothetical protein